MTTTTKPPHYIFALFAVIVLEGYVVLSSELLAIRQTIPFVGSGSDTVSIIIAAVLMPLAFGYHAGGQFKPGFHKGRYRTVRGRLLFNLTVSLIILAIGLSHVSITYFFIYLIKTGISNRLILTTIYAALFLVYPVFLLGQTIPLISQYFSKERLSQVTGKILFFSTIGSFLGAVFSTLVLMSFLGVHYTASLNFMILAGLIILLMKRKTTDLTWILVGFTGAVVFFNSGYVLDMFGIVENNKYSTITVFEDDEGFRHLSINNNASSKYSDSGEKHPYVHFIEDHVIKPLETESKDPLDILVIGAGGFTMGSDDDVNRYDFVDIDKALYTISEQYLLKEKIGANKAFYPEPARAFLTAHDKTYDFIMMDAYLGALSIPEHLVTREFFAQVKNHLKPRGVVAANFVVSPTFEDMFSRRLDTTIRSVFPYVSRHVTDHVYVPTQADLPRQNVIYIYRDHGKARDLQPYSDLKNQVFWDTPKVQKQGF